MSEQPKSEAIICNCGCKITKYDLSWTINPCLQHDPLTNAAPDLLAACEALLAELEDKGWAFDEITDKVSAAILKAKETDRA